MVKLWCSCVRHTEHVPTLASRLSRLLETNPAPREGDLVVVRVLGDDGAYTVVENPHGREMRLYEDDVFVGVLATRKSGTHPNGELPKRVLNRGDRLGLVAVGGLVADIAYVPHYYGGQALPVEVRGFLPSDRTPVRPVNLRDLVPAPSHLDLSAARGRILAVAGTAAETGKTTLVCSALRALHRLSPAIRVAAVKACGTGRRKDLLRYHDAGAVCVRDYVDHGWPSTYNIASEEYSEILERLIGESLEKADFLILEVGGDPLEARAPEALAIAARLDAAVVLCVQDALGAIAGLRLLRENHGLTDVTIATLNQNPHALAQRLGLSAVLDLKDQAAIDFTIAESSWVSAAAHPKSEKKHRTNR